MGLVGTAKERESVGTGKERELVDTARERKRERGTEKERSS